MLQPLLVERLRCTTNSPRMNANGQTIQQRTTRKPRQNANLRGKSVDLEVRSA
jgi:hypothetical protein